jgi:flagellar hook-associated protein 3 FlgL
MMYARFVSDLQTTASSLYKSQEQISSGKKVNRPSDDPAAMYSIISGNSQLATYDGYQSAITDATTLLNATSVALDSIYDIIDEATTIGEDATSLSEDSRTTYMEMLDNLITSTVAAANTKVGERYIFSGYASDQPAVDATTGWYQGTPDRIQMEIDNGLYIDVNVTADEFIAYGSTSAASTESGLITAAGTGVTSLTAAYTTNGGSLSISLGGGPTTTVTISAGATIGEVSEAINNANTGVRAEVINANASGTPADYRLMLSASPTSAANAISVTVTTTDAAGTGLNRIASAAMTSVVSPDRTVIGTLSILRTAIELGDKDAIQRAISDLDTLSTITGQSESEVGGRISRMEKVSSYLKDRSDDVTNQVSSNLYLTDVELAALIVDVQQKQTSLTALRSMSSDFLKTSLFDYL